MRYNEIYILPNAYQSSVESRLKGGEGRGLVRKVLNQSKWTLLSVWTWSLAGRVEGVGWIPDRAKEECRGRVTSVEIKHLAFSVRHELPHPVVPSWLVSLVLCALISSSKEQAD